jgi:hypothetical protein
MRLMYFGEDVDVVAISVANLWQLCSCECETVWSHLWMGHNHNYNLFDGVTHSHSDLPPREEKVTTLYH